MFPIVIKEEQIIWLALIGSLLIHCLLFVFSGKSFIQQAQFSVRPAVQTVEISYEEMKDTSDMPSVFAGNKIRKRSINSKKIFSSLKNAASTTSHNDNGVRVKADPNYFQNPSPEYPELARQMRQEGLVMLAVDVGRSGEAVNVAIMQSSGFRLLDQSALKAVRHWKFQPGSIGGFPVNSTVTVPIRFRLEK